MQALDLVRATLAALGELAPALDRLALLLANSQSIAPAALSSELQRVIAQLGEIIHSAALRDDPLLRGGSAKFLVEDPHDLRSTPLQIELPDLSSAFADLAAIDLAAATRPELASQHAQLASLVQTARTQLSDLAQRLSKVLASQRPPAPSARATDDGFVELIQSVRERVLHAGDAALRVQGSPSSRATWLIEALRDVR